MNSRIEDYALIGDLRSAALVSVTGSVDWLCLADFHSPVFGSAWTNAADPDGWLLAPLTEPQASRCDLPSDGMSLRHEWVTREGAVRVADVLLAGEEETTFLRVVDGLVGAVPLYTRIAVRPARSSSGAARFEWWPGRRAQLVTTPSRQLMWLTSDVSMSVASDGCAASFTVRPGERVVFALVRSTGEPPRSETAGRDRETTSVRRPDAAKELHGTPSLRSAERAAGSATTITRAHPRSGSPSSTTTRPTPQPRESKAA